MQKRLYFSEMAKVKAKVNTTDVKNCCEPCEFSASKETNYSHG